MSLTHVEISTYLQTGFSSNHTTNLNYVNENSQGTIGYAYANDNTLPRAVKLIAEPISATTIPNVPGYTQEPYNFQAGQEGQWQLSHMNLNVSGHNGSWSGSNTLQGSQPYWRMNDNSTNLLNPLFLTNLDPNANNYGGAYLGSLQSAAGQPQGYASPNLLSSTLSNPQSGIFAPDPIEQYISNNIPIQPSFLGAGGQGGGTNLRSNYKVFTKALTLSNGYQFDDGSNGSSYTDSIIWYTDANGNETGYGYSPVDMKKYVQNEEHSAANRWDSRVKTICMFNTLPLENSNSSEVANQIHYYKPSTANQNFQAKGGNKVVIAIVLEDNVSLTQQTTTIQVDINGDAYFNTNI